MLKLTFAWAASAICLFAGLESGLAQNEASQNVGPKMVTAPAVAQEAVDFNHPPRDYVSHRLHGWDVLVEKELEEGSPERAKATLGRLELKLGEIAKTLPAKSLPDLQRVKVFLMAGPHAKGGGRNSGLEYFRSDAPKHHQWLDERMGSSIVIYNAENYLRLSDLWAIKSLMHEMGHAHHLEHWGEDRADIFEAWSAAMTAGQYKTVRDEDKETHHPNYAAQNHLEYFAELSAAYFVGSNYFPRDRAALKEYDPVGYELIEKIWEISQEEKEKATP